MKNFSFKILIALFAFSIGIVGAWTVGVFSLLASSIEPAPFVFQEFPQTSQTPVVANSGKVEIHLKRFYKYEDSNVAEFELVNDTSEPISYMGYNKNTYCDITFKRGEKIKTVHQCTCGTGLAMQTLGAGERALYSVTDIVARYHLKLKRQTIKANLGFEVIVGADNRKEMLWTEEVVFPE